MLTTICGDTIIDGIHFKRKYERGWLKGEKKPDEWTATDEYIGQNLGKVYMYSNKLKRAKIDMDFSLSEGDTFTCCGYEDNDERQTFLVTGIEQKWGFEDLVRKKFIYLQSKDNPDITDTWIEGIGSMTTGITGTSHLIPNGSACKLTLHTWGDIILHVAEDFSTSVRMLTRGLSPCASGFQEVKRVDRVGATHNGIPTPHVHENGKVRPAKEDEL